MHNRYNGMEDSNSSMVTPLETDNAATAQELIISTLATSDVVAKLLIEKGLITEDEFLQRLWQGRITYERLLNPEP